jgi:hypothetical protein
VSWELAILGQDDRAPSRPARLAAHLPIVEEGTTMNRLIGLTGALVLASGLLLTSSTEDAAADTGSNYNCVTPPEFVRMTGGTENQIEAQLGVDRGKVVSIRNSGRLVIRQYPWCNHTEADGYFQVAYAVGKHATWGVAATFFDFTCTNPILVECGHQPKRGL